MPKNNEQRITGNPQRLVKLGVISSPHGMRGQVKIRSFTEYPPDLTAYGPLQDKTGKTYRITIASQNKDVLIASIEGIENKEDAEALRHMELFVERSALPVPKKDEYYHEDLIGIKVATKDGKPYGEVTAVYNFGAGDILEIRCAPGKEELLAFNQETFPVIDIAGGFLILSLPEVME